MTARDHRCDSGNFDRTICPEPCGSMHSYCDTCGKHQGPCAHDRQARDFTPDERRTLARFDAAPDALGLREEVAEVVRAHRRGDWSDGTYSCQGCRTRFEDGEQAKFDALDREPTRAEIVASRNAYSEVSHPGWSLDDYNAHIADALTGLIEAREKAAVARALRDAADFIEAVSGIGERANDYADGWYSALECNLADLRDRADRMEGSR